MIEREHERVFKVSGMTCGHCRNAVEAAIRAVSAVQEVRVDLKAGVATVVGSASDQQIISSITEAGYEAESRTIS